MEGPVLVREAVAARVRVDEQFVLDPDDAIGDSEVVVVDARTLSAIASVETARGPVAVCRFPAPPDLSGLGGWLLVADGLNDPGNLGTLVRCAEIAGASAVVVTRGTTDLWSPKCVRASAGALFHVPVLEVDSLVDVTSAGYTTIGTTSHVERAPGTGEPSVAEMENCDFTGRVAVVLGNEARGLPTDAPVDRWVTIRHLGRGESLNVAMAGAILALHVARSREAHERR